MDFRRYPRFTATRWPDPTDDIGWSHRLRVGRRLLQKAWGRLLGSVAWDVSVTLTFDPKRHASISCQQASQAVYVWCNLVAYTVRRPVEWVYALERHRDGRWHAHVLILRVGVSDLQEAVAIWTARNGGACLQAVYDAAGISMYSCKAAMFEGEMVLSDTLGRPRADLPKASPPLVRLYPKTSISSPPPGGAVV